MSFLLDHLSAFLVGASLLVGLLFVQQRGRQTAVEATVRYRTEVQTASFVEGLTRDLENARTREQARAALGLYERRTDARDLTERALGVYGTPERTDWIEFVTLADPEAGDGSPLVAVAYKMEPTGATARVRGADRPLYQVVRYVCADPCRSPRDWAAQGGSAPAIVGLRVRPEPAPPATGAVMLLAQAPGRIAVVVEAAYATPKRQAGDQDETAEVGLTRQGATVRLYAAGTGGASLPKVQNGAPGIARPPWTTAYTPPPPAPKQPAGPVTPPVVTPPVVAPPAPKPPPKKKDARPIITRPSGGGGPAV